MPKDGQVRMAGYPWWDSGTTRGTTTSSGVFKIQSFFPHKVVIGEAWDDANEFSRADLTLGTTSTYYTYQPIAPAGTVARFRVRKNKIGSAASNVATLATSVSGLQVRYLLVGY